MASYGNIGRQVTSISNTTETPIVSAGGTNDKRHLYSLRCTNGGATDVVLTIRDATGGSAVDYLAVKAGTTAGWITSSDEPMEQTTKANAWTAQASASSTLYVTAQYIEETV